MKKIVINDNHIFNFERGNETFHFTIMFIQGGRGQVKMENRAYDN